MQLLLQTSSDLVRFTTGSAAVASSFVYIDCLCSSLLSLMSVFISTQYVEIDSDNYYGQCYSYYYC